MIVLGASEFALDLDPKIEPRACVRVSSPAPHRPTARADARLSAPEANGETLQRLRAEHGLSLRQAAADIGIAVETLRRLEQGKPAHAGTANPVARFYDVDPSELFVMEGPIDQQLVLLEAVLGTLDVDGLRRAANAVGMRALAAGKGAEREFFKNIADELEREADRRSPGFGDAEAVDVELEPRDTEWVESLPERLRGVSFNMHGEALVYTTDDHLLHSDLDWQPMRVRDGVAQGLVLDRGEERFVAGMWALNEYARRKRSRP